MATYSSIILSDQKLKFNLLVILHFFKDCNEIMKQTHTEMYNLYTIGYDVVQVKFVTYVFLKRCPVFANG